MILEPGTTDAPMVSIREGLGRRVYPAESAIFTEGETGAIAYILLRGDVTIFLRFGTDQQRAVTELKPGQMFGLHAVMAGAHRAASAYTRGGCEVIAISERRLQQKLDEADPLLRYWVDYLSKRIIDLST